MARGTGPKRAPRQPFQRTANPAAIRQVQPQQQQQPQPQMIIQAQQQQQQQYQQQQILQPGPQQPQQQSQQWYTGVAPQQIQIPPRLQQQQAIRQRQLQYIPPQAQQQQQQQQQHTQLVQQHQQQNHQQLAPRLAPQTIHIGNKRHAQEPVGNIMLEQPPSNYVLTEQALRDPLISALDRNINKQLISHTLHRTFGVAKIF